MCEPLPASFLPHKRPGGLVLEPQEITPSAQHPSNRPHPRKVQNRNTPRLAPGLGCFWVVREGAQPPPPSPLLTTIYLESLEQTPSVPVWPDFYQNKPTSKGSWDRFC